MMKTKNIIYLAGAILGIGLFFIGAFVLQSNEQRIFSGLLIGVGSGLFGLSVSQLLLPHLVSPKQQRRIEIEAQDERNVTINNYAKARSFDGMDVVYVVLIASLILMGIERMILFMVIGAYIIRWTLYLFYLNKLHKEM